MVMPTNGGAKGGQEGQLSPLVAHPQKSFTSILK